MDAIGIIAFTRKGCALARSLACDLSGQYPDAAITVSGPARYADAIGIGAYDSLDSWTAVHFADDDALIFVGASGIAVRAIAPYVRDKFTDPAVVSVDEAGLFSVPLLSGHVGGANELARAVAHMVGGQAAVSTATDVNGLFAVDEWAARHNLAIVERSVAKAISAALLDGRPVGYRSDFKLEDKPAGIEEGPAELGFEISLDGCGAPFASTLHLVPKIVTVGVGCRRGTEPAVLEKMVLSALDEANVSIHAVEAVASIDVKQDEPAILELAANRGWDCTFYSAEELAAVPGEFSSSDFVRQTVGVDNVCERAACARGGALIAGRLAGEGVTVALACRQLESLE